MVSNCVESCRTVLNCLDLCRVALCCIEGCHQVVHFVECEVSSLLSYHIALCLIPVLLPGSAAA